MCTLFFTKIMTLTCKQSKFNALLLFFSCSVMSDSLPPHGLQHARPPCPSPSPEVCPSSWSLHRWCHPAITTSDTLFCFCPWSFPASGTFPMSHLFTSHDQNTGASASASVFPVNSQGWPLLRLTGMISLLSKGLAGVFSSSTFWRDILWYSAFFMVQLSQPYMTTGKTIPFTIRTLVSKVMSLAFQNIV